MEKDRRAVHGLIQASEKKTEELSTLFRGEPSPNKSGTPRTVEANPSGQQRFAKALHARFTPLCPPPDTLRHSDEDPIAPGKTRHFPLRAHQ